MLRPRQFDHFPNLVRLFLTRAAQGGDRPFLWAKSGNEWQSLSWRTVRDQIASLAAALRALGIERGDRVLLVSENRPEWFIADFAIMAAGGITVPTYITNTERDHHHVLENSGAKVAIVSSAKLARALMPATMRSVDCHDVIGMEDLRIGQTGLVTIHDWARLMADHAPDLAAVEAEAERLTRGDLACLIYTSGTGGAPRGVKQHHGALLHNVHGCIQVFIEDFGWDDEVFLSFLPLSHAYEHTGGQALPLGLGAQIYYAQSLDRLASNIEEVRPTVMVVVPRLFEMLRAKVVKAVEKQGGLALKLLGQAEKLGAIQDQRGKLRLIDQPMNLLLEKTLRPKIRARFGGRIKAMVSGGAPLNPEVGAFFLSLGLRLLQGYGQTEAGPIIACNRPKSGLKMDTVGPPLAHTEVKIAEDGEILVRGELVMKGYWRNEAETDRVLRNGWLHTGDVGEIDAQGRVRITDRKKDLIVNDKGDNISPQKIEGMLTLQPEILQAMVVGDKRPHLVGLVVPDPEWLGEWAAEQGVKPDLSALAEHPGLVKAMQAAVDRVNTELSIVEKVRRIAIAPEAFSIENELLTPSMKIRRHMIRAIYDQKLNKLYGN